jgi:hypothetical protein
MTLSQLARQALCRWVSCLRGRARRAVPGFAQQVRPEYLQILIN